MKKINIKIFVILIFLFFFDVLNGVTPLVIPVIDPSELEERIKIDLMESVFKGIEKFIKYKEIKAEKKKIKKFISTYEGIKEKVLELFTKDDIYTLFESGKYFCMENTKDIWKDIWMDFSNIFIRYKELKGDIRDLTKTEIYKKDLSWKKYIDKFIDVYKNNKKEMRNVFGFIKDLREFGEKRIEKVGNFKKDLKNSAKKGKSGKMYAELGYINMERLKIMVEKNVLEDVKNEILIKGLLKNTEINLFEFRIKDEKK